MTTTTTNPAPLNLRRLTRGTLVVNADDAESGRIIDVSTYRRNGVDAFSYRVETASGREIWEVGQLFVPESPKA